MSDTNPPADTPAIDADPHETELRESWTAPPDAYEPWADPYFDHDQG